MSTSLSTPIPNEFSAHSRVTKDGRKITYESIVVQNPERARACGQGAKSSTDRRPVDPPPIIQLKIFDENTDPTGRKDITYSYRANFFMYADLEHARPQATNSRMARDVNNKPVLCGAPVSGISYLDRPNPAGYFIFPDLSVRHEGDYKLSFTLWEDLKDKSMEDPVEDANLEIPTEHVTARCNVKSKPFTVYSAKKFPGLSESTAWSRAVAEQGCRVRIRRDIRMRKRGDTKDSKGWASDDEDLEPSQLEDRRLSTMSETKPVASFQQDPPSDPTSRPRSPSHVSTTPARPSMQRTSAPDMNAQYHQQNYAPPYMVPPSPQHAYPAHATHPGYQQQYDHYTYAQQHQPQPATHPQQQLPGFSNPPPPYGYGQTYYNGGYPQPYAQVPQPQMQSPNYLPQPSHLRHNSLSYAQSPQDYQAGPGAQQYPAPPPPRYATYAHAPNGAIHTHHPIQPSGSHQGSPALSHDSQGHSLRGSTSMQSLPPIQTHLNGHHTPYDGGSALDPEAPAFYPISQQLPPPDISNQYSYNQPPPPPPPQYLAPLDSTGPTTTKRSYASTFDTQHMDQRLQSGARPDPTQNYRMTPMCAADEHTDSEDEEEPRWMEYKRADGTMMRRLFPKLI